MICPNCNHENGESSSFCARCGTLLTNRMPQPRPAQPSVWVDEIEEKPSGRRMVPLGVVGFVLGLVGILSVLISKFLVDKAEAVRYHYDDFLYSYSLSGTQRYIVVAVYSSAFAMIAGILGLLAAIFCGKAIGRAHDDPSRWRGSPLYVVGVIFAIAAMAAGIVCFFMGYDLVR